MYKCISCGKQLGWNSDFNLDEIYPEECINGENGVVSFYSCGECELDHEITVYNSDDTIRIKVYEIEE